VADKINVGMRNSSGDERTTDGGKTRRKKNRVEEGELEPKGARSTESRGKRVPTLRKEPGGKGRIRREGKEKGALEKRRWAMRKI